MIDKSKIKVEILKHPTEQDWLWAKTCTLNTVGKKLKSSTTSVDLEYKQKLLASEHSPIRELWFGIKLTIPYFISVHIVRHHIGCNHYVSTQRDDRHPEREISREDLPQGAFVSHILSINAQELMFFMRKRLCNQADPLMRYVANLIKKAVLETNPEFEGLLVPLCEYRNGMCTEMFPCEKAKTFRTGFSQILKILDNDELSKDELENIIEILYKVKEKESI